MFHSFPPFFLRISYQKKPLRMGGLQSFSLDSQNVPERFFFGGCLPLNSWFGNGLVGGWQVFASKILEDSDTRRQVKYCAKWWVFEGFFLEFWPKKTWKKREKWSNLTTRGWNLEASNWPIWSLTNPTKPFIESKGFFPGNAMWSWMTILPGQKPRGGMCFSVRRISQNCLGMGLYESFMILASLKKRGYLQSGPLLVIDGVIFPTSGVMSLLTAGFQGPLCRIHHFFPS